MQAVDALDQFVIICNMSMITLSKRVEGETKSFIMRAIYEVLSDPDFGMELTKEVKARLKRVARDRKTIPFSEIKRRYL